jgi:DNA-binding transcriptional regulator YhcF (GntR family)
LFYLLYYNYNNSTKTNSKKVAMILTIQPESSVPLYQQLRNQVVQGLVQGSIVVGEHLPRVRQLAVDLGINLHTVNKAYKVLEQEGYLRILGRRGAVICEPPGATPSYLQDLTGQLAHLYTEAQSHGVTAARFSQLVAQVITPPRPQP